MRLREFLPRQFAVMVMLETEYEKVLKGEDISRRTTSSEEKGNKRPIGWGGLPDLHASKTDDEREPGTST